MFREVFDEHARIFTATLESQMPSLEQAGHLAEACLRSGGKILIFGNGGSAADAQHFAAELVGRFEMDRDALPAVALTVNTSTLTAVTNDYGFDRGFSRQVEGLARAGDVAIAISTSGNSANVILAAEAAQKLGCKVIGMTGDGGGGLAQHCDALIAVPAKTVARIQEMHELCLHALAWWLERRLFADAPAQEDS